MPQRFVDDLEGEVIGEEVHEGGLGEDIFSADLDGEEVLLLNIRGYRMHISNKKQEQSSAFFNITFCYNCFMYLCAFHFLKTWFIRGNKKRVALLGILKCNSNELKAIKTFCFNFV